MDCQPIAANRCRLDKYCLPAMNHSNDVTIPPRTQCLLAKSEIVAMKDCHYSELLRPIRRLAINRHSTHWTGGEMAGNVQLYRGCG